MRHITKTKNVSFASLTEIRRGLRDEAERLADDLGLKGGGPRSRAAASAHLLNWVSCYLLSLPTERRNAIATAGKAIFEAHAASDEPFDFDPSVPAEDGGLSWSPAVPVGQARAEKLDRKGQDEPAKAGRLPKRRS